MQMGNEKNMLWLESDPFGWKTTHFGWKTIFLLENHLSGWKTTHFDLKSAQSKEFSVGKQFSLVGKPLIRLENNLLSGGVGGGARPQNLTC